MLIIIVLLSDLLNPKVNFPNSSILSFDVWDTLIRRDCHPEEIKTRVAQRLISLIWLHLKPEYRDYKTLVLMRNDKEVEIARENQTQGFDDEYVIQDVFERVLLEACKTPLPSKLFLETINMLVDFEVAIEIQATRVDEAALQILSQTSDLKKIVISDFYMSSPDLSKILAHHNLLKYFSLVVSSCDHKVNKKSGKLFQYLQQQHGYDTNNWIHVGDNLHADVEMANKNGLKGHHHFIPDEEKRRDQFRQSFANRPFGKVNMARELELARSKNPGQAENIPNLIENNALALPFAVMGLDVIEIAAGVGVNTIYFIGNESKFLQRVVESILLRTGEGDAYECKRITLDQKILHLAGALNVSPDLLYRSWHRNGMRTFETLLPSIGLEVEPFEELLKKHSLSIDNEISGLFAPAVCNFFFDKDVQNLVQARIDECRIIIESDLKSFGVADEDTILLISTDWHADMQDSLSNILPGVRLHGYYLGLQNPVIPPREFHSKRGFFFEFNTRSSEQEMKLARFSEPLSFIVENPTGDVSIEKLQNHIITNATVLAEVLSKRAIPPYEMMPLSFEAFERFFTNPPKQIARCYNLKLSDRFKDQDASLRVRKRDLIYGVLSKRKRQSVRKKLEKTAWPHATLRIIFPVNSLTILRKIRSLR